MADPRRVKRDYTSELGRALVAEDLEPVAAAVHEMLEKVNAVENMAKNFVGQLRVANNGKALIISINGVIALRDIPDAEKSLALGDAIKLAFLSAGILGGVPGSAEQAFSEGPVPIEPNPRAPKEGS